jgi:hypothetical protein
VTDTKPTDGSRFFTLADVEVGGAADRDALLAALNLRRPPPVDPMAETVRIGLPPSLWPTRDVERKGRLHHEWTVADHTTGVVLAKGRALFERWAWHRAGRAAAREYHKRHTARKAEVEE